MNLKKTIELLDFQDGSERLWWCKVVIFSDVYGNAWTNGNGVNMPTIKWSYDAFSTFYVLFVNKKANTL